MTGTLSAARCCDAGHTGPVSDQHSNDSRTSTTFRLADVLREQARLRPDAVMLRSGGRSDTWAELDDRSNQLAAALTDAGVTLGSRVAIIDKNGPEFWELLFATAKLGAVLVSVNWRLSPAEMAGICRDAGAVVLVVGPEFVAAVEEHEASLTEVRQLVAVSGSVGTHDRWPSYAEWSRRDGATDPRVELAADDVAIQLYTSGTTGLPKGVMLTHANLSALLPDDTNHTGGEPVGAASWEMDADSVVLATMPLFHIAGCGWALAGMARGAETVLEREFDPARTLDLLSGGVTHAFLVPVMLQVLTTLTTQPGAAGRDYGRLRYVVYGASPVTEPVLRRALETFPSTRFCQVYGLTETTGAITQLEHADHDPGGPRAHLLRSAGKPYPYVELKIVEPGGEAALPPGQVGEVWTRSAQNAAGYWDKPGDTAAAFPPGGWFRSGDAGYLDEEGYLFLTDRIKDMIVSGGENIYPIEVENVLAGHPAVVESAVIGVPSEQWGETVKAVVVRHPEATATAEELIAHCRARIAHFKCPTSVDFVDVLPRNPSGKLLKRELREPYWADQDRAIS
ncbi:MAG: long-chain acyl-CoA synthetase [Frankiaceae bacterium]|nr:long-chain acyl-CoA synthetase [Frankiaceae bacterium]